MTTNGDPLERSDVDRAILHRDLQQLETQVRDLKGEVSRVIDLVKDGLIGRIVALETFVQVAKERTLEDRRLRNWTVDKLATIIVQVATAVILAKLAFSTKGLSP